ncbi:MAG: HTTM domain-containing protein [Verrucomicrobiaceae bacterium]|nr:HTTM domain-containing protein [Verrucomicrobiaceae bacterium]
MKAWNSFWFARQDPLPMAVCRIGVGALLLAMFLALTPNWDRFYAADGMLQLHDEQLYAGRHQDWYSLLYWTEGVVPVGFWRHVCVACSVGLMLGWRTRLMTISLFLLMTSLINRCPWVVNGEDLVLRMLLFYGMFSPWGMRLSLDARRHASKALPTLPLVWAWRLMQVNFLLIYAVSLPYKFAQEPAWWTGDAMHWAVASDMWWEKGRMPWITLALDGWIRRGITWGTVIVEGLAPFLVWFRATRVPMTLCLVALHVGIAFTIPGVTLFTLSMVAGAALFLPADFYQTWAAHAAGAWQRSRSR